MNAETVNSFGNKISLYMVTGQQVIFICRLRAAVALQGQQKHKNDVVYESKPTHQHVVECLKMDGTISKIRMTTRAFRIQLQISMSSIMRRVMAISWKRYNTIATTIITVVWWHGGVGKAQSQQSAARSQ